MQVFKLDFKDHPGAVQFCVLVLLRGEGPVSNLGLVATIRLFRVYVLRGVFAITIGEKFIYFLDS